MQALIYKFATEGAKYQCKRDREHMTVKAIKYSSVTGQKVAEILHSRNTLDHRHTKVTELSDD